MTTTKDVFYDSFCHEMHIGMTVMAHTSGGYIYGHIVDMVKDTKGNEKYIFAIYSKAVLLIFHFQLL